MGLMDRKAVSTRIEEIGIFPGIRVKTADQALMLPKPYITPASPWRKSL